MKGAVTLHTILYSAIALMIFFVLMSSIIMREFNTTYNPRSCVTPSSVWYNATSIGSANCYNFNASPTASNICYDADGVTTENDSSCCVTCSDYGFRGTTRGLTLLIFTIALVGIAVTFLYAVRKRL